jgi:hypothetical protein
LSQIGWVKIMITKKLHNNPLAPDRFKVVG